MCNLFGESIAIVVLCWTVIEAKPFSVDLLINNIDFGRWGGPKILMATREGIIKREKRQELVQLMPKLFENRQEAEFALDIIKETFSILKIDKSSKLRFPIYLDNTTEPSIRINLYERKANILGFKKPKHTAPCKMEIMLWADLKGADNKYLYFNFDKQEDDPDFRVYKMPIESALLTKEDLYQNYFRVLDNLNIKYKDKLSTMNLDKENEQKVLRELFINVISDPKERDDVLQSIKNDNLNADVYSFIQCSDDTGFDIKILERWTRAVNRKGQAILYGPPGTGKTHMAKHLAKNLIGGGDGFIEIVQFHPAYAYEDFIEGIRPRSNEGGGLEYPTIPGRFLEFCEKAKSRKGKCVLIIDEINRADLAKVFGELMYLLEHRSELIPLSGGRLFQIPGNVLIIGTMNTADRSIALVDHALRRRFAFLRLGPNYDVLQQFHEKRNVNFSIKGLIESLRNLNNQINDPHYEVGISFFLRDNLENDIEDIWCMEIEPYLEEYYFDRVTNVENFRWDKIRSKIFP